MKKYIYTLYGSIVVTMLAVIIASAHNIYVGRQAKAEQLHSATAQPQNGSSPIVADDSLSQRFSFRSDSVPVMNYVPLQGPEYSSLDTINAPVSQSAFLTASARRQQVANRVAFTIDSLIATRSYGFYPSAMQAKGAQMRMIYNDYYYLYISPVDLEVHIPVEHSPTKYLTMLNFDSNSVADYVSRKQQSEWVVSFSASTSGDKYDFQLVVSTVTGEAELLVASPRISMRYLGTIGSRQKIQQSRAAKFFQELGATNPAATN